MDVDIFTNQMTGQWIAQSTSYSLLNNSNSSQTFINNFTWAYIENNKKYIDLLLPKLQIEYVTDQAYLYTVEFKGNKYHQNKYYVVLLKQNSDSSVLLKLNYKFQIINRFIVKYCSTKSLSLISYIDQVKVFQQIYFLNKNVKIIKSIVKKKDQNIGTYFSSEIRISQSQYSI